MAVKECDYVYLTSFISRLRGMLGRKRDNRTYVLRPCNSIHTFGMRDAIDVAFVDEEGEVVEVIRGVLPMRVLNNNQAYAVCERFSKSDDWPIVHTRFEIH